MWIYLLLIGNVVSIPTDEFGGLVHEAELSQNHDILLKQIVPSGYSPHANNGVAFAQSQFTELENNEHFETFKSFVQKGVTSKGLTFNIYDDNMRNATLALFRLLRDAKLKSKLQFSLFKKIVKENINSDMLDYATRLAFLYGNGKDDNFLPPFILKPNYFVNGETIMKALFIKQNLGKISADLLKEYQIYFMDDKNIVINTNYSSWNYPINACDEEIKYFIEDAALNSYYYGVHLLHPFWMTNEELEEMDPKHAEHYYFAHQQLYARYNLEKLHLGPNSNKMSDSCESDFFPYLYYENGLPFPVRSSVLGNVREELTYLKSIDIGIRECIHRGLVIMENGTLIKVSEDNYIDLMTKLIRANLDGIKAAKLIRSIFGYGNNGFPVDRYNPSPSVLYHAQTTLREPVYWFLIQKALDYYSEYTNNTEPYDISKYEDSDLNITDAKFTKITTVFEYFLINLKKALEGDLSRFNNGMFPNIYARQRRLNHLPFALNFTIESKSEKHFTVRLFLGPQCGINNCWDLHSKFFLLDCFNGKLKEGPNYLSWSPVQSSRYLNFDVNYSELFENAEEIYDIYVFPRNLIIPKGLSNGLNLTLFVMVETNEQAKEEKLDSSYLRITRACDNKPLNFPFHRQAKLFNVSATNFKFYNISIYHEKKFSFSDSGYFSPYLY